MSEATIQKYIQLANSIEADSRAEAARELKSFLNQDAAVSSLVTLLGDEDWRVRRAAVDSFVETHIHQAIPKILTALYDDDNAGKRNAAIDILTRYGKDIVPYLQPHLDTDNLDVRMFLIQILGDLREDSLIAFITQSLEHTDQNVVSAAVLAAGKIGHPESAPRLMYFLKGKDLWLTFQAIEASGEMQEPSLIPDLVRLCESSYFRKPALKALSHFHHPEAYRALTKFLVLNGAVDADALQAIIDQYDSPAPAHVKEEERSEISTHIQNFLSKDAEDALLKAYTGSKGQFRKNLIEILGIAGSGNAVPLFIEALQIPELSELAVQALISSNEKAVAPLLSRLEEEIEEDEILMILYILNTTSLVPDSITIHALLNHSNAEIRFQAFRILARPGSTTDNELLVRGVLDTYPAIPEICRPLLLDQCRSSKTARAGILSLMHRELHSELPERRASSLEFLTWLEGESAFPLIFQSLKDEDALVRRKAVALMSTGYHHEFQKVLIGALADEDSGVRESAARALASYSSQEVMDALIASISDDVMWVRIAAYESLAELKAADAQAQFIARLENENLIAQSVLLKCLGKFRNSQSKDILLKYLNSSEAEIRKSACESLGVFNESDTVFRLFTLLQTDPDWGVRAASIRALTGIRPFRLQEALLERLKADNDPFVRKEILNALQKLGIESVPSDLFGFLQDPHLADSAYEFLFSNRHRFLKQLQEALKTQPPAIRRYLKSVAG